MAGRRCPATGCPTIITDGSRYCPRHAREYEARRGTSTQRGYGAAHRGLRAQWQWRIDSGDVVMCADGCGTRITGTAWDLGHTADRTGYVGPQVRAHNRSDGGSRGNAAARSGRDR